MSMNWEGLSSEPAAFAPPPEDNDELDQPADAATDEGEEETAADEAAMLYPTLDAFVRDFLITGYSRHINGNARVWAGRWWEYPEAVSRLGAMWRAFEHLRLDPATGLSTWYTDHADPHMRVLLDKDGPFGSADEDDPENLNRPGQPLPYVPPHEALYRS